MAQPRFQEQLLILAYALLQAGRSTAWKCAWGGAHRMLLMGTAESRSVPMRIELD